MANPKVGDKREWNSKTGTGYRWSGTGWVPYRNNKPVRTRASGGNVTKEGGWAKKVQEGKGRATGIDLFKPRLLTSLNLRSRVQSERDKGKKKGEERTIDKTKYVWNGNRWVKKPAPKPEVKKKETPVVKKKETPPPVKKKETPPPPKESLKIEKKVVKKDPPKRKSTILDTISSKRRQRRVSRSPLAQAAYNRKRNRRSKS